MSSWSLRQMIKYFISLIFLATVEKCMTKPQARIHLGIQYSITCSNKDNLTLFNPRPPNQALGLKQCYCDLPFADIFSDPFSQNILCYQYFPSANTQAYISKWYFNTSQQIPGVLNMNHRMPYNPYFAKTLQYNKTIILSLIAFKNIDTNGSILYFYFLDLKSEDISKYKFTITKQINISTNISDCYVDNRMNLFCGSENGTHTALIEDSQFDNLQSKPFQLVQDTDIVVVNQSMITTNSYLWNCVFYQKGSDYIRTLVQIEYETGAISDDSTFPCRFVLETKVGTDCPLIIADDSMYFLCDEYIQIDSSKVSLTPFDIMQVQFWKEASSLILMRFDRPYYEQYFICEENSTYHLKESCPVIADLEKILSGDQNQSTNPSVQSSNNQLMDNQTQASTNSSNQINNQTNSAETGMNSSESSNESATTQSNHQTTSKSSEQPSDSKIQKRPYLKISSSVQLKLTQLYPSYDETQRPAILIQYNSTLTTQAYKLWLYYFRYNTNPYQRYNVIRHYSNNNQNQITEIIIDINVTQFQRLIDVNISLLNTISNSLQQDIVRKNFKLQNSFDVGQYQTDDQAKTIKKLNELQKKTGQSSLAQGLSFVGIFSLIMNCPQEIAQLIFLNYSVPLTLYNFEAVVSHWILENHIPDWEVFPQENSYSFLKFDVTNEVSDPNFKLLRFSRINNLNSFLYNSHFHLLLVFGVAIVTYLVRPLNLFKKQKIIEQLQQLLYVDQKNYKINIDFVHRVIEKLESERYISEQMEFVTYSCLTEGKYLIFTNSIFLTFQQPYFSSTFQAISFALCLVYLILSVTKDLFYFKRLSDELQFRNQIEKEVQVTGDVRLSYVQIIYEQFLRRRYKYYLQTRSLDQKSQFFSVMIGQIKKLLISFIIVVLYDKVVIQLFAMIILNSFLVLVKFISRPYRRCFENIIIIIGDIIFLVVLGLKFNDYRNMQSLKENSISPELWLNHGWITVAFEVVFICCFLMLFVIGNLSKILCRRPIPQLPPESDQEKIIQEDKRAVESYDLHTARVEVPINLDKDQHYHQKDFNLQVQPDMDGLLKKIADDEINRNFQNLSVGHQYQMAYSEDEFEERIQKILTRQASEEIEQQFTNLSSQNYWELESKLFRKGKVQFPEQFFLNYEFKRSNEYKLGEDVTHNPNYLRGKYKLWFCHDDTLLSKKVFVGICQNYHSFVDFIEIFQDQLGFYSYDLYFNKVLTDLVNRQFQVKIQVTLWSEVKEYIILLSGSQLLLFNLAMIPHLPSNTVQFPEFNNTFSFISENLFKFVSNLQTSKLDKNISQILILQIDYPVMSTFHAQHRHFFLELVTNMEVWAKQSMTTDSTYKKVQVRLLFLNEYVEQYDDEETILTEYIKALEKFLNN